MMDARPNGPSREELELFAIRLWGTLKTNGTIICPCPVADRRLSPGRRLLVHFDNRLPDRFAFAILDPDDAVDHRAMDDDHTYEICRDHVRVACQLDSLPSGSDPRDITQSVLFERAAAEAREASRRHWAKGGPADRKYPPQPMPWWPEAGPAVDVSLVDRRRSRRRRP